MKVLVLTVTAGQGHNTTANAVSAYLDSMGIECKVLDTFTYFNKLLGDTINRGYLASVDNAQRLYATVYKKLEKRKKNANELSATRLANMVFIKKMKKYIDDYKPDVIVVTHIFAGVIIDIMKQRCEINAKTIGIVTDFTIHPFWEEGLHLDYVVIANEFLTSQIKSKGYTDEQILPIGIPIHPKFSHRQSKEDARRSLGLDPDKLTFLLMGGSMGYGSPDAVVKCLDALPYDFQIINVCGSNKEAKEAVDALHTDKTVLNYGFTTNIDQLMDACDCIVSKPGGLTTSESLAKNLPMVIVNYIPGQEERNVQFLLNTGCAMEVNDSITLDNIIEELCRSPQKLKVMREATNLIGKPNATKDLCEFIAGLDNK